MATRATSWLMLTAVVLLQAAAGNASASDGFLAENSCRGENALEGAFRRVGSSVSAETHRGCGEVCSGSAADSAVAPGKVGPKITQEATVVERAGGEKQVVVRDVIEHPGQRPFVRGDIEANFDPKTGTLKVEGINVDPDLRRAGISDGLYEKAVEAAGGSNVKRVVGELDGTNLEVLQKTGDISQVPRVKSLEKLGFTKHSYDPKTRIITSERP